MPRSVNYKASSIVFFEGDRNENIYILQSGSILLRYTDIETGTQEQDLIKTGEFFGVKSALGRYPKDETAMVLKDSQVLVLTVAEFEAMAMKNSRIVVKMLRVFSNQLRRIHKQVTNLISNGKPVVDAEKGLFNVGEHYYRNNRFQQAAYIFRQYVNYYPQGADVQKAQMLKTEAEACMQGKKPTVRVEDTLEEPDYEGLENEVPDLTKEYFNGVSLFSQGQYEKALRVFKKVHSEGEASEYGIKSISDIGKCFFQLNYWDECIKQFTIMIQKYPKHPDLLEGLFYVGECYRQKEEVNKSVGFYKKILTMAEEDSAVYRKARKALEQLGGSDDA